MSCFRVLTRIGDGACAEGQLGFDPKRNFSCAGKRQRLDCCLKNRGGSVFTSSAKAAAAHLSVLIQSLIHVAPYTPHAHVPAPHEAMATIQQLFGELERLVKREEHEKVLATSNKSNPRCRAVAPFLWSATVDAPSDPSPYVLWFSCPIQS